VRVAIRTGEFERCHTDQFTGFDEIEVEPGEDVQLLSALEFSQDDFGNCAARDQLKNK
jgi:hypothetical protein